MINALHLYNKVNNKFICYIVGDGPKREFLNQLINKKNLNDKIILLGKLKQEQVSSLMNNSDYFIMPSINEGNPTVLFEALYSGNYYIGSEVGGVPEIITSKEYGLLYKNPTNHKALFKKINVATSKKINRKKIHKYGDQFSSKKMIKQTLKEYYKLF